MYRVLTRFMRDEAGAITIDWIVFSAGIITILIALVGLSLSAPVDLGKDAAPGVIQQTVPS